MRTFLSKYLGLILLLVFSTNAWSALVSVDFAGTINKIKSGYGGALDLSADVTGQVIYDDALLTGGRHDKIALDSNPSFGLTFNLGPYTFTQTDDADYGSGYPIAFFKYGTLKGLDFYVPDAESGLNLIVYKKRFFLSDDRGHRLLRGSLDLKFHPEPPLATPVPAAVWLFGSGLLGLIGMAWRRARSDHQSFSSSP